MYSTPHHLKEDTENNLNKERESSRRRGVMVRHATKAPNAKKP
jgi:hypothetical protein